MACNLINRDSQKPAAAKHMVESVRVRVPSSSSSSPNPKKCCIHGHDCSSTLFMLQNHSNFKCSAVPGRFMYYQQGSWLDFSAEVTEALKSAFLDRRPIIDLEIGGSRYLFDFLRMLQIDFETGKQRSVAWIDENGKCFFPKIFVGEEELPNCGVVETENPKIEIEIRIDDKSCKRKRDEFVEEEEMEVSSSNKQEAFLKKRRLVADGLEANMWPNTRRLKEVDEGYLLVKNCFLSGLKNVDPGATVTAIHQCVRSGPLQRARLEVFQKQIEITKNARGDANMVFAWHGASAKDVESILAHGFAMPRKYCGHPAHGVGIHLSPVGLPHLRAMHSEPDENGVKHVILCRVILGNVEMLELGSNQSHPSSVDFDTGADNPSNPKLYVVWCTNMNSHILPECIVSYRPSVFSLGQVKVPSGVKYQLSTLFTKIKSCLPSSKVKEVVTLYETFRAGKLAKEAFIKELRSVAGDEVLHAAIHEIRGVE